jgi:hypothetical protein
VGIVRAALQKAQGTPSGESSLPLRHERLDRKRLGICGEQANRELALVTFDRAQGLVRGSGRESCAHRVEQGDFCCQAGIS